MNLSITLVVLICFAAVVILFMFMMIGGGSNRASGQMSRMVASQRYADIQEQKKSGGNGPVKSNSKYEMEAKVTTKLSLQKKLLYAQMNIPPVLYYILQVVISLVVALIVSIKFDWPLVLLSLASGPVFMGWLVNSAMMRRFKDFDIDYAPFLLSLVSMLKTGMQTMTAMQTAAAGLEEDSLVREEVEMMSERLRFGIPEEKAIGAFGETIYHPEIELFVQAILLSKNLGGSLSDTLDRLSKQVRKRQYFRDAANSAVGMQRGSVWFLLGILVAMEIYMYIQYPQAITDSLADETGWMVWQGAIGVICVALYWIRRVTNIRA